MKGPLRKHSLGLCHFAVLALMAATAVLAACTDDPTPTPVSTVTQTPTLAEPTNTPTSVPTPVPPSPTPVAEVVPAIPTATPTPVGFAPVVVTRIEIHKDSRWDEVYYNVDLMNSVA